MRFVEVQAIVLGFLKLNDATTELKGIQCLDLASPARFPGFFIYTIVYLRLRPALGLGLTPFCIRTGRPKGPREKTPGPSAEHDNSVVSSAHQNTAAPQALTRWAPTVASSIPPTRTISSCRPIAKPPPCAFTAMASARTPWGFAFSPGGRAALAANHGGGSVPVIDLNQARVTANFPAGTGIETPTYS